jgi:hypothetical protein
MFALRQAHQHERTTPEPGKPKYWKRSVPAFVVFGILA